MSIYLKKFFIILFSLFILVIHCAPSKQFLLNKGRVIGSDKTYIKVLILKTSGKLNIKTSGRLKISLLNSQKIIYNKKNTKLFFFPEKIKNPLLVEAWGDILRLNNKKYRGMLELHNVMGKLYVINVLRMDEYLSGVVPGEMSSSWPLQALKAQAVAARTYAYYHLLKKNSNIFDLDATTNFQVYKGYSVETSNSNLAVSQTSGEILTYLNKPILAFFHSTCGGRTASNGLVWKGEKLPYLHGVKCNYCSSSKYFNWQTKLSLYSIQRNLKKRYRNVGKIKRISLKSEEGRVKFIVIVHSNGVVQITGNEFRLLFPAKKIKSLFFKAKKVKDGLIIIGHGFGHGVGMCQYGAKGMAEKGIDYKKILNYYYTGINIIKIKR